MRMSREIKFRAWDKQADEPYMFNMDLVGYHLSNRFEVMQYTGLKDLTGKDIYEDDILEQQTEWGGAVTTLRKVVKWNTSGWNIRNGNTRVVIGNVWENPELGQ